MKPYDPSTEAMEIRHLKKLLQEEEIPEMDYSDKIMREIRQRENEATIRQTPPMKATKRIAFLLGLVALFSGFAYAGDAWLDLWNKSGQIVMRVVKTNAVPLPEKQLRALEEVAAVLAPGESAVVYFGSKEAILNNQTDQILWTQAPVTYTDWSLFIQALQGPLAVNGLSSRIPADYEFKQAGIMYLHQADGTTPPFLFGRSSDGLEYGYSTRQPSSDILSASVTYQKGNNQFFYSIGANQLADTAKLFVEKPRKADISTVNGLDVYYYENTLFWTEKVEEISFDYTLSSPTATRKELIEFAKNAIPAN